MRQKDLALRMERMEEMDKEYQELTKNEAPRGNSNVGGMPLGVRLITDDDLIW